MSGYGEGVQSMQLGRRQCYQHLRLPARQPRGGKLNVRISPASREVRTLLLIHFGKADDTHVERITA